jgi:peptidoglycan/xylan/chitin deacetylase (PgdA/CDA1 family)
MTGKTGPGIASRRSTTELKDMMTTTGPSHLKTDPTGAETAHWAAWATNEPDWKWPAGKTAAVTLTFDVDAETGAFGVGDEYLSRLSTLSEQRFSVVRGLPRILKLLQEFDLKTTFFVPGWTAENYPHAIEAILNGGHEIGHHGYVHSASIHASASAQREEIERGFTALESVGAPRPRGYRNPNGEMTLETVKLLVEYGFAYDSSFLGDDRPYVEKYGELELLELPWHWSLDDWPYFGFSGETGGNMSAADTWRRNMWDEYESALDERRNVNFVCHPEFIGRGYRFKYLANLLHDIVTDGRAWIPTMEELADHARLRLNRDSAPAWSKQPSTTR